MSAILDTSVGFGAGADDLPPSLVNHERNLVIPYDPSQVEALYRQTRETYTRDPKQRHSLIVYISSMVQLRHQHELFYLSHQLNATQPNDAISWYAVGAYYWSIQKYEQAHKYLKKALKKDKDCSVAWILLGHVLSVVEESEQALAAYRSVVRLLPANHLPLLCIGKEFIRTNNLWLAAHTLQGAQALQPQNITILNELGVAFVKLNKLQEGLEYFHVAIAMVEQQMQQHQSSNSRTESLTSAANVCEVSHPLLIILGLLSHIYSLYSPTSCCTTTPLLCEKLAIWKRP